MDHQLARILSADVQAINVPLSNKVNSLNNFTQAIDINTSFINNFKLLLQQELSSMGIQQQPQQQSQKKNKIPALFEELKLNMKAMQSEFIQEIKVIKEFVDKGVIECVKRVAQTITNIYEKKIKELESRIEEMSKQNYTYRTQFELKHSSYGKKVLVENDEPSVLLQTNRSAWKSYIYDIKNQKNLIHSNKQNISKTKEEINPKMPHLLKSHLNSNYTCDLPAVKMVKISNPPLEEGFGTLKMGSQTVYKGFWKYRKFNGKGKLTLPDYTYDGSFKNGVFQGRGTLKIGKYEYIGEFRQNKANGQGMLKMGGQNMWGRWEENRMVDRYC